MFVGFVSVCYIDTVGVAFKTKLLLIFKLHIDMVLVWVQCRDGLMDAQPVNWNALDELVVDYLDHEHLVESTEDGLSVPPSPRDIIHVIRLLVEAGCITEALHLMHQHVPMVLEDQRLLFRLHKQVFDPTLIPGLLPGE